MHVIIPAYNESQNIKSVVDDWYPVVERLTEQGEPSKLVVIDDGSRDDTYEQLQKLAAERPLMEAKTKPNSGHGATVLSGYRYALADGAEYIFQTDSDGQTLPSEFEQFWQARDEYDMVIGWRRGRQDGLSRVVVTKVLKYVIALCFGVIVTDANTPFRLIKAEALRRYIDLIPEDFNLSNVILSVVFARKNCRVKYVPITFRPRQGGVNSINLRRIIGIGWKALGDFRRINRVLKNSQSV